MTQADCTKEDLNIRSTFLFYRSLSVVDGYMFSFFSISDEEPHGPNYFLLDFISGNHSFTYETRYFRVIFLTELTVYSHIYILYM